MRGNTHTLQTKNSAPTEVTRDNRKHTRLITNQSDHLQHAKQEYRDAEIYAYALRINLPLSSHVMVLSIWPLSRKSQPFQFIVLNSPPHVQLRYLATPKAGSLADLEVMIASLVIIKRGYNAGRHTNI